MRIQISPRRAVDCRAELELPLSALSVWGQLRDFRRYACQDPFHAEIEIEGNVPRIGARLTLCHRYAGLCFRRVGRILVWREGVSYTFSDLSRRRPRAAFPHVFSYRIEPLGQSTCRLHIRARGRWTNRLAPRWAVWLWLRWVFGQIVRSVQNELMLYHFWRKRHARHSSQKDKPIASGIENYG